MSARVIYICCAVVAQRGLVEYDGQVVELTLLAAQLYALLERAFDELLHHYLLFGSQACALDQSQVVFHFFVLFLQLEFVVLW